MHKRHLIVVACATISLALSACGSDGNDGKTSTGSAAPDDKPVTIRVWTFNDNSREAARYHELHPNVTVLTEKLPDQDYYAKLQAAISAKTAPDLALVENDRMPSFQATQSLADLSKLGASAVKDKFNASSWSVVERDGKVFGIPQGVAPMALYYRKDIFDKLGIAVPTTWEEYAAAAEKLHAADPSKYITDFPTNQPAWFASLAQQLGARWFGINGDSWTVSLNDAPTKRLALYWQGLIQRGLAKPIQYFTDPWNADLASGRSVTWLAPAWGVSFLASAAPRANDKWRIAPLPQWTKGANATGYWGGASLAVPVSSKHQKAALDYAIWLNSSPEGLAMQIKNSHIYPAAKLPADDATLNAPLAYYGDQQVNKVFAAALGGDTPAWQWGPTMPEVYTELQDAWAAVGRKPAVLSSALDAVTESTKAAMKKRGFSVR